MSKQIQDAYIVAATRTPVAKRMGHFKHVRPDDLLAHAIENDEIVAQAMHLGKLELHESAPHLIRKKNNRDS